MCIDAHPDTVHCIVFQEHPKKPALSACWGTSSCTMFLVLERQPCETEEHQEEEDLNAQVLPLGDMMLRQAIILQELHNRGRHSQPPVCLSNDRIR